MMRGAPVCAHANFLHQSTPNGARMLCCRRIFARAVGEEARGKYALYFVHNFTAL